VTEKLKPVNSRDRNASSLSRQYPLFAFTQHHESEDTEKTASHRIVTPWQSFSCTHSP
jgi:hypothetical protein